jgi:hypothetical protein
MTDLHYRPTPNGQKIAIDLEETRIPYKIVGVSLGNNDQFGTGFFKISPNNKIPAIVDYDPQDGGRREPRTLHQNRCSSGATIRSGWWPRNIRRKLSSMALIDTPL